MRIKIGSYYILREMDAMIGEVEESAEVLAIKGKRVQVRIEDWGEGEITKWVDADQLDDSYNLENDN